MGDYNVFYISEERFLREFASDDMESTTMAIPDSQNKDMANSINKAKQTSPNSDNVIVDTSMFDNDSKNDPVNIDITARNGQDARNQINNMMNTNPQLRTMQSKGNLFANVHMEGRTVTKDDIIREKIEALKKRSTKYTKQSLTEAILRGDFD